MAGPMKEDYLKYLTTSDSYMGYPLWTTNPCSENYLLDNFISMATFTVVKPKIKDISFIKKEIPKFKFPKEPISISLGNVGWAIQWMDSRPMDGVESDEDTLYERMMSSFKIPSWLRKNSDPIPQIFDEFH